ncbi:MAG: ketopantoate reductase family protein [Tumebacillaceae bacterium]
MRFLVVGAGAVGGYFGGRLVQKGEDVTFLVRPKRQAQLQATGLVVHSVHGDFKTPVQTCTYGEAAEPFDVILLTVKAYNFPQMKAELAPYIGAETKILPLLNGYDHFPVLQELFGQGRVLGGCCHIESTLNEAGEIVQTSQLHNITLGDWEGGISARTELIFEQMQNAGFNVTLSEQVQRDVWNKYIFIASFSGITTLMHAAIGPIRDDEYAYGVLRQLVQEVVAIANLAGAPLADGTTDAVMLNIDRMNPQFKSSMLRDMEKGLLVEADHIHGALLQIAKQHGADLSKYPLLQTVYGHLKLYEQASLSSR